MSRMKIALLAGSIGLLALALASCGRDANASAANSTSRSTNADPPTISVGVAKVGRQTLDRKLTVSSELVPFQEIDVYAKQSGYVKELNVDYGSRVKAGQVMAVLEIPELQMQLEQDDAATKNAEDQVTHAKNAISQVDAQHNVLHLQYERLNSVAKSKPGMVAQQEVDEAQGKDLAAEAQIEEAQSSLDSAQSQLLVAKTKREHDQVLFDYSKITAPFDGVVTQRYANLGTLLQAGTNSSTQAMPLVRLSQDNLFRLVIPVPESYVRYITVGDPVDVNVPALNRTFPAKVTRFSVDVREDTRTMHTEVDVPNPRGLLIPGMYAEATITLERRADALAVPVEAINRDGDETSVDVVTPANRIEKRDVTLGIQMVNDTEVVSGLKEGDLVVVSDRSALKPGEAVLPKVAQLTGYTAQGAKE